jgi:microcystin-dependent protein
MDPFVGEIRIVGFNFAPRGWASCDGQLLPISQNTALFSLLGTYYGGDGKSTFALPNFQGSAPMHWGDGVGLSSISLGETGGAQNVTMLQSEMPAHTHGLQGIALDATVSTPASNTALAKSFPASNTLYQATVANTVNMAPDVVNVTGGGQPHNNMQPYLCLYFIIAMQGVYPPRP